METNKNRILIISEDYPSYPGGIAQWAKGVAEGLTVQPDTTVRVLYRPREEYPVAPTNPAIDLQPIKGTRWKQFRTWICRKAVREAIEHGFRPTVVIATTWNVARGLTGLQSKYGFKLVLVVHGLEVTRPMPALKRWWLRETLESVNKIIAVSRFTRDRILRNQPSLESKIIVLPNGINPDDFKKPENLSDVRKKFKIPENIPVLLTFARVIERKGHDTVIKALPEIIRQHGPVIYLIAGGWDEQYYLKLKNLIAQLNLQDNVIFSGYIPDELKASVYYLADIYVMISREVKGDSEGFGITYLEANLCGLPVIAGNSGGVSDAVLDGETGILTNPEYSEEVERAVIKLLTDRNLKFQLGATGKHRVLENMTWKHISESIQNKIW